MRTNHFNRNLNGNMGILKTMGLHEANDGCKKQW